MRARTVTAIAADGSNLQRVVIGDFLILLRAQPVPVARRLVAIRRRSDLIVFV